jgi:CelD/BcsL family acetyltransferase involved in cellulose biosynthesis
MSVTAPQAAFAQPRLEVLEDLDAARPTWSELAVHSGNVFATWEWATTWWHHFGRGRPLLTRVERGADGTPRAILPLYISHERPLRVIRFIGHGPGDQLGPICRAEHRAEVAGALAQLLREEIGRRGLFLGEQLPGDESWSALLGGTLIRRERSPVLDSAGMRWEDWLASRSSSFRQRLRRRERALSSRHLVSFRLANDPERLERDLDTLFALHRKRWQQGPAQSAFADSPALEAFHRDFAARALERGWLRLWFLELDGEPAAAWYGLRFGGAEAYYQAGRDTAWDRYGVGFLLLVHSVRAALEDGISDYRFLRGDEAFKAALASADPGLETIAVSRGLPGRMATAAVRADPRLRSWARAPLRRLAG